MAICKNCKQEMKTADGCTTSRLIFKGTIYKRSTETWCDPGQRCSDCGAKHGSFHHLGCDVERCPKCHGQMISCPCWV